MRVLQTLEKAPHPNPLPGGRAKTPSADTVAEEGKEDTPIKINLTDHWPLLYGKQVGPASTARREYVPSYQNEMARKNQSFPRAKLGTAYRNWPRQYGGATSRAQHRYAVLGSVHRPGSTLR